MFKRFYFWYLSSSFLILATDVFLQAQDSGPRIGYVVLYDLDNQRGIETQPFETYQAAEQYRKRLVEDLIAGNKAAAAVGMPPLNWSNVRIEKVELRGGKVARIANDPAKTSKPDDGASGGKGGNQVAKRPITIKAYKKVNDKWVEQPDRKYETSSNFEEAVEYYKRIRGLAGWTATWNAPGWPKPDEPKGKPKLENDSGDGKQSDEAKNGSSQTVEEKSGLTGTWGERKGWTLVLQDDGTVQERGNNGRVVQAGKWSERNGSVTIRVEANANGLAGKTFNGKVEGKKLVGKWVSDTIGRWDEVYERK